MDKHLLDYLEAIQITEPIRHRIEEIIQFYSILQNEPIEEIFVTDYRLADGSAVYENLWLFSRSFIMEAKFFLNRDMDSFDIVSNDGYSHALIRKANYDFIEVKASSMMQVDAFGRGPTASGTSVTLKASRKNCEYLKDIVLRYFLPPSTR